MSEKTEPLRATLKAGTGYDSPWLTIDATTPDELQQRLRAIIDSNVLETVAEAAGVFRATQLTQPQGEAPAQQAAPQQQQAAPQQQSQGWGAAQQQSAPRQQGGGQGNYGAQTHPEGKQCEMCGKVLEFKKTGSGKGTWRCPDWRWNNGNPNGHTQEWAN